MFKRESSIGTNEDRKLALSFGALVLVIIVIISFTMLLLYRYQQLREENRLSAAIAGILSESISRVSFSGKYHARLLVEEMKSKVTVLESISVETFDGEIIAHSDPSLNDTHIGKDEPAVNKAIITQQSIFVSEHMHNGIHVKEIIIPFYEGFDRTPAGIIRIGINVHQSRNLMIINYIIFCFMIVLLTSAAIWLVFRLSRFFGSKVRNLAIQMQTVLDSSPALIYMKDSEGHYLFINRAWADLFNTTNEEVRGKTDLELFEPGIAEAFMTNDRYVIENNKILETEEYAPNPDGIHSYNTIKVPVHDSSGKLYAICGISADITSRKRAEEALLKSEEQYRTIIDLAPDPFFHGDARGNFININNAALEITGYTKEELLKMNMKDLFPKHVLNETPLRYDLLEQGLILKSERVMQRKNGELLTIEMNSKKMPDGTYQSFFRDITRRKKAEEALKESEEVFRHFMENSPIYVFFKDEEIRATRLSRNFEQMIGIPMDKIIGKTMDDLFPSDLAKSMIEDDKHVLQEGKIISVDEELNGRYYTTIKFPISIDGKPRYLAGYTIDITERKLAEKAIDAERERLLVTLRSIGDAVITTGVDGKITLMNRVAEELTGWTSRDASGMPLMTVFDIVNEITKDPGENPFERVMNSGGIIELPQQTLLISRDGSERLIADSAAPITGSDSSIIGIVLVFRDITEKRKTEMLIQNSQKLESLGVLAGGIAHDFNNLLGGMFGYLELLKLQLARKDINKAGETADKAMQVFNRTKALTQQLLTFAKGGEPLKKIINLQQMLVTGTQFVLSGTKVTCTFNIQPDLWTCIADENQIGQVLDNIIINAIQAMPHGGEITINAENITFDYAEPPHFLSPGRYVRVAITDQGLGIPEYLLTRIFDPFYTTKATGTGLGLATSYSILKKHGGTIFADSAEGEGSTFSFYLPASDNEKTEFHISGQKISLKFHGKILIMDDEEYVRTTTQELLSAAGLRVDTASHGEEAAEMYKSAMKSGEPYDAVILDLTVKGGMGGKETVRLLRDFDPGIKAIASSGYSVDPVMANPSQYGFTDRLIKPYSMSEMIIVLQRLNLADKS